MLSLFGQGRALPLILPRCREIREARAYLVSNVAFDFIPAVEFSQLERFGNAYRLLGVVRRLYGSNWFLPPSVYRHAARHRLYFYSFIEYFVQVGILERENHRVRLVQPQNSFSKFVDLLLLL